jgi:hypothetical protein
LEEEGYGGLWNPGVAEQNGFQAGIEFFQYAIAQAFFAGCIFPLQPYAGLLGIV